MLYWYEQDKTTAILMIYGIVGDWFDAASFTATCEELALKYPNIIIRGHCYGGSVMEGNVIYNTILNLKAHVTMRIEGVSASMFTIIMLAADRIEIVDNGLIMVHAPSTCSIGNAAVLEADAKLLRIMTSLFTKRYMEKTGQSKKEVTALLDGTDHWFSPEEALAMGLVDEIIPAVVKNVKQQKPEPTTDVTAVYNRYSALLTKIPNQKQPSAKMKKLLIAQFHLQGVTEASTDEEVAEALKKATEATQAQPAAQAPQTPNPAIPGNPVAKAQAESVLAAVEGFTGKPFEAAFRATLLEIGESSGLPTMQATMKMLAPAVASTPVAPTPALSLVDLMKGINNAQALGANDRSGWKWDDYQKNDPDALAAVEKADPAKFNALYKAKWGTDAPK